MNENELMLGDWCRDMFGIRPQRVIGLEDGWVSLSDGNKYGSGCIKPIRLTTDILEKNGFEKDEEIFSWNWKFGIIEDSASYDMATGQLRIFKVGGLVFIRPIGYVHQLQHAMRLCDIEKEIEL